jgi:glycosyltransferase involved in cell wall biosynthesis
MRLLQVCNVGDICGGTAACAWSIVPALPGAEHSLLFLSRPTPDTRAAFVGCRIESSSRLDRALLTDIAPDVVLLHNTARSRVAHLNAPLSIQYLHARIDPAPADLTLACSAWLRDQFPRIAVDGVLYQPVVVPPANASGERRALRERLIVGRLCTPTRRKWPAAVLPFYRQLAADRPQIDWEFVGCPADMQDQLRDACRGRSTFWPAGPSARAHLSRWDALLYHHPSLTETFGRTVAEAQLAGCIPVIDARGGFREQVTSDTGFLCDGIGTFRAALQQLHDVPRRRQMSRAATAHSQLRFSTDAFARRFRALLAAAATAST